MGGLSGVGAYLPPTPEALQSGEWGPLAPGTRPAWPPANPALAAVSSSPAGAPACCHSLSPPLPLSFLHSLPAQPQLTRARRHAQAGAKPLEAQVGAREGGLTLAGPQCPQFLTPPGAWSMEWTMPTSRLAQGWEPSGNWAGDGIQANTQRRNALGGWEVPPRPSWITTTPSRDTSYFGILIAS